MTGASAAATTFYDVYLYASVAAFGCVLARQAWQGLSNSDGRRKKDDAAAEAEMEPAAGEGGAGAQAATATASDNNPRFSAFQRQFLAVYLVMMAADWMQGPYVYELYAKYGFTRQQNGILFIFGFGSSLIFGTWAGPLADKYGRKFCCMLYGITYALSCATKHVPNFNVLIVGRLLGGFATSILWSSFEAWMVSEHNARGFAPQLVGSTFSRMITLNGIVAIVAGVVAQYCVNFVGHPVAPFDASAALLLLGTGFIYFAWPENYGDQSVDIVRQLVDAWHVVRRDPNVAMVGLMQSLFEGAMYTFVFLWTPALEGDAAPPVPHGLVFATFMTASSFGGALFGALIERGVSLQRLMLAISLTAAATMALPVVSTDAAVIMGGFTAFEVVVGLFWPCIGTLRAKVIPEASRASVINLFRVPLNVIVCGVLVAQGYMSVSVVFTMCVALHAVGAAVAWSFCRRADHALLPTTGPVDASHA